MRLALGHGTVVRYARVEWPYTPDLVLETMQKGFSNKMRLALGHGTFVRYAGAEWLSTPDVVWKLCNKGDKFFKHKCV